MYFIRKLKRKIIEPFAPALFSIYFRRNRKHAYKKGCVSLSFDCDLKEDIRAMPKLLELLKSYEIKASFACIGKFIEKEKRLHTKIIDDGHEIINHTYTHPNSEIFNPNLFFNKIPYDEQKKEILGFDKTCRKILDYRPVGFRTPHFGHLHTENVYRILEEIGYLYSSSTVLTETESFGLPYHPSKKDYRKRASIGRESYKVIEIPMMTCPVHYFPLFDTWHCFRSEAPAHTKDGEFFNLFRKAADYIGRYKITQAFYFDPMDVIKTSDFERCLEFLNQQKIEAQTCRTIAENYSKTAKKGND